MADATPPPQASLPTVVDWRTFLTDYPPGTRGSVEGALAQLSPNGRPELFCPALELRCEACYQAPVSYCVGSPRAVGKLFPGPGEEKAWDSILLYCCRKCQSQVKSYGVRVLGDESYLRQVPYLEVAKLGEWPPFNPPTPSRVNSLIGPDRELFFKGRQAERDGLGIGAFAYYRRIVEVQKNRLLGEIVLVARRTNAPAEAVAKLEKAMCETQFSKAVEMAKDAVPSSLFISGRNPLLLLHAALSRNLHGASDAECLRDANAVRVMLCEFAERLGEALKDQRELDEAVSRLLNPSAVK